MSGVEQNTPGLLQRAGGGNRDDIGPWCHDRGDVFLPQLHDTLKHASGAGFENAFPFPFVDDALQLVGKRFECFRRRILGDRPSDG